MRVRKVREAVVQSLTKVADFGANQQQPRPSLTGRCSFPHVLLLDKSNSDPLRLGLVCPLEGSGPFALLPICLSWNFITSADDLFLCAFPESTPQNAFDA